MCEHAVTSMRPMVGKMNKSIFFFFEKLTRPYTLTTSLESKKIIDL